ncbi:hypothetical protein MOTT27_02439 [Mycobacterium intracellulare subsp. yongonense]|uniref:hypothetical protein n=1 Tax=Mycobacterium TaxID=1763 RepID=UPI0004D3F8B0|nr:MULTISPECIES: hypothetical protein [Mycobacterium]ARR83260.1 hypothetical protein MOTT27_02439 [Mycobacterium intracellulare subsp. yongonense]KEF95854.1 hypothetical protein K883_04296 [Mycobacterium sp. TKK-01-0059]
MSAASLRRVVWWAAVVALCVATLAAALVGGWQVQVKSRQLPPVADQPAERQAAVQAASSGTVKILSYSPDTLDQDFSAAEEMLAGDFLAYYKQFTAEIVKPAALEKRLTTTATVLRAGVESLTSENASILIFVNQTTTSREKTSPSIASSSVRVSLNKVNGTWRIVKFDPQ